MYKRATTLVVTAALARFTSFEQMVVFSQDTQCLFVTCMKRIRWGTYTFTMMQFASDAEHDNKMQCDVTCVKLCTTWTIFIALLSACTSVVAKPWLNQLTYRSHLVWVWLVRERVQAAGRYGVAMWGRPVRPHLRRAPRATRPPKKSALRPPRDGWVIAVGRALPRKSLFGHS